MSIVQMVVKENVVEDITLKNQEIASWVFHPSPRIGGSFKILNSMSTKLPGSKRVVCGYVHQAIDAVWLRGVTPTLVNNTRVAVARHTYTDDEKHMVLEALC